MVEGGNCLIEGVSGGCAAVEGSETCSIEGVTRGLCVVEGLSVAEGVRGVHWFEGCATEISVSK